MQSLASATEIVPATDATSRSRTDVLSPARMIASPSSPWGTSPPNFSSSSMIWASCSGLMPAGPSGAGLSSTGAPASTEMLPLGRAETSSRTRTPSAGTVSPRLVRTPFSNATDMRHGMPYSRETMPRWLSGAPCSVMTPRMPAVSAGVRNVVVPPRTMTM